METRGIKSCEYCHKPFKGGARARYCSNSCSNLAWRKHRDQETKDLREQLAREQVNQQKQ